MIPVDGTTFAMRPTKWFWILFGTVLVIGAGIRFTNPCGCFGVTFLRPAVIQVRQMPNSCSVLRVPAVWRDMTGARLDTRWDHIFDDEIGYEDRWKALHYAVWRTDRGLLVGMVTPDGMLRSQNQFRFNGRELVPAESLDWGSSALLPYVRQPVPSRPEAYPDRSSWGSSGTASLAQPKLSGKGEWSTFYLYSGQPLSNPLNSFLEGTRLWVMERSGFVNFYDRRDPAKRRPPLEFRWCGEGQWYTYIAAWHGPNVYTFPLSLDGRSLVLCDFSKEKAAAQ